MIYQDILMAQMQRQFAREDREYLKQAEAEQKRFDAWVAEQERLSEIDPDYEWTDYEV